MGGPARNIAEHFQAKVTGVTINEYQVTRAKKHTAKRQPEAPGDLRTGGFTQPVPPPGGPDRGQAREEKEGKEGHRRPGTRGPAYPQRESLPVRSDNRQSNLCRQPPSRGQSASAHCTKQLVSNALSVPQTAAVTEITDTLGG